MTPSHPFIQRFDHVAELYDSTRQLPRDIEEFVQATLRSLLSHSQPTLEIGVGTGRIARLLADAGVPVLGLDASLPMLRVLNRKMGSMAVQGDAHALPFASKSVSSTLFSDVLHLLHDPWRAMNECARVARNYIVTVAQFVSVRDLSSSVSAEKNHLGAYTAMAREAGVDPLRRYGLEIPVLIRLIPPAFAFSSNAVSESVTLSEALRALDTRTFSPQWSVPVELHSAIMARLVRQEQHSRLERTWRCEITAWRAADLEDVRLRSSEMRMFL